MRIMIIRNAYGYDFGGAERLAVFLAREIRDNDLDPIVFTHHDKVLEFASDNNILSKRSPWLSHQNWSGVWLGLLPAYLLWQLMMTIWYIAAILINRFDAVHIMSRDDFISATIAGRILGRPVIWTDCADLKFVFENHGVWYKNPVGKLVYVVSRLAHRVTLVSKNEQRLITESLGHATPVNYGVTYMVGRDEPVTPIDRGESGIVFCATSRLVTDKGIRELIEAFSELSKKHPDYHLWIIGDGPEADDFKKLAEGIERLTFLGHQTEPLRYLAAADIYLHPTYHEGFSLGLAEAAMLSRAIVATNVGGNPELVGDRNGLLVPIKDSRALAIAMEQLASDPELRQKMGRHGRADYLKKFDLRAVVKNELIPLYDKV